MSNFSESPNLDDVHANMAQNNVAVEEPSYVDYFGFSSQDRFYLPDGKQYIEYGKLNEGAKRQFQKLTSRDLRVQRTTGDALMKMDPGAERHELIKSSVVGWHLMRRNPKNGSWEEAPFNGATLNAFLDKTDPSIIEDLEKDIRKANPWLMDEMTVEDIDREINNLQELRVTVAEREAGKSASAA